MFNAKKSQVLLFECCEYVNREISFIVNNQPIAKVQEAKHLGHMLSTARPGYLNSDTMLSMVNKSCNILLANFGHLCSSVLKRLFSQYCGSFYGILLCNFQSKDVNQIHIAWRKAIRRLHRLPNNTHKCIVNCLCHGLPFEYQMHNRLFKFYVSLLRSHNCAIESMLHRLCFSVSNLSRNVSMMDSIYCIEDYILPDHCSLHAMQKFKCMLHDKCGRTVPAELNMDILNELLAIRDGSLDSPLSREECVNLLNELCTN